MWKNFGEESHPNVQGTNRPQEDPPRAAGTDDHTVTVSFCDSCVNRAEQIKYTFASCCRLRCGWAVEGSCTNKQTLHMISYITWRKTVQDFGRIEVATSFGRKQIPDEFFPIDTSRTWQALLTLSRSWTAEEAIRSAKVHESMHFTTGCALHNISQWMDKF